MKKSIQRTLCFVRKAALTAIVCFAIFFASVSCASLPKGGRSTREQTENADGAPESVQHENAASERESNGDADTSGEHTAPDTETMAAPDRMTEERTSNTENLSERVGGELPEKSEEAMRGSSAIDEPRVREEVSENGGAAFAVPNEALSAREREDAARENESAPNAGGQAEPSGESAAQRASGSTGEADRHGQSDTPTQSGASAAGAQTPTGTNARSGGEAQSDANAAQKGAKTTNASDETSRSAEDARGAEAAQKTKGGTSEKTINPAKSAADARSAKDKDVGVADKSAKDSEALRKAADPIVGAKKEIAAPVVPSRSVHVAKNQYLDVVYPGGGWIYLGETDGTKLFSFFGKRIGDADTVFTLRAKNAGKAILHFYKNDILTGNAIDDYLEAIVDDRTGSAADRITAPSYADIIPPRPASSGSASETQKGNGEGDASEMAQNAAGHFADARDAGSELSGGTADFANGRSGENASADENNAALFQNATKQTKALSTNVLGADDYALGEEGLLEKAKSAYDEKNYARALALLDLFFARATSRIDEGLYLKGQTLEAKSAQQNIKGAIGAYDELLQKWPESKQWQAARRRSIYLKRMYVDIR